MDYNNTGNLNSTTNNCDKCSRNLSNKGYIEINGWKICGICQYEERVKNFGK